MAWTDIKATYNYVAKTTKRPGLAADLAGGANFNIFNIANGPVLVMDLFGVVTTVIGAGLAVPRLQFTPAGGAQTPLGLAAASIATDAPGTVYVLGMDGANVR